jgi:glycosyltransferase involved in cell wall biosynthesis
MSNILFVVHRYAPYPGGSEINVQNMAEGLLARGHDVTVLAETHKGDYNNVKVTSDYQRLADPWDLIVVHGGDVYYQNIVHLNGRRISSPVLYLIIKPSETDICMLGLHSHRFIGYGMTDEINHIKKHNVIKKARRIRYGIRHEGIIKTKSLSSDKKIFVSAGGFSTHKGMKPLAAAFESSDIHNAELHLYGYCNQELMPKQTDKVKVFFGLTKDEVYQAMANADAYIMNSYDDGFGLVLLEAMMNKTPWFARDISGAHDMARWGTLHSTEHELMNNLRNFERDDKKIEDAYDYVMANHTVQDTCNDIEDVLLETLR